MTLKTDTAQLYSQTALVTKRCVIRPVDIAYVTQGWLKSAEAVTDRKDDAPAAVQAAIANVVGLGCSSGGVGLAQRAAS